MRESVSMLESRLSRPVRWEYDEQNRRGDHICYISDLSKLKAHYPQWSITRTLDDIVDEMLQFELQRLGAPAL
jgi:CDP-paratose 2-epimerase